MKIRQILLFFGIFLLLLGSCESPTASTGNSSITNQTNVPSRKFWAQNLVTERFYQLDAELLAESVNCRVWAEKGSGVSVETATSMARAYENEILPKMLDTFAYRGPISDGGKIVAYNTVELADYMADGDGKLCILLLDIVDDFKPGVNDSYCAGYFWAVNLFAANDPMVYNSQYSNECDMIYIDTYPGSPGSRDSNATFAHEMQHLMSYVSTFITNRRNLLDVWIDEGLSTAAEWLYYDSHSVNRVGSYIQDPSGLIQRGNNFFVWGNHENESQYALVDDYATVYLFFQWLRLQVGSIDIYYDIILSDDYDYKAVANAANWAMPGHGYSDWGTLLKTWYAANYINAPSGPYGYKNDPVLKNIRARTAPAGEKSFSLAPGEGVYSITNNFSLPDNAQFINYAGLNGSSYEVSDTKTFSGGALLTFNANSNASGSTASGITTGVASVVTSGMDMLPVGGSRVVQFPGPVAVGPGDVLKRNGHDVPRVPLQKLDKGIFSIE